MPKKRYSYNMTSQYATAGKIGALLPTCIEEVAPGDTWSGKVGLLVRLSPLKKPQLMDLFVDQFFIYVPHRLVYADWESFLAEGPMDTPTYTLPTVSVPAGSTSYEALFMKSDAVAATTYSALRLYAYNLIWNEIFRADEQAVLTPTDIPSQWGRMINLKKDYWSNLNASIGEGQADHTAPVVAGEVSATEILEAIARQKIAMKRATYGTRYIDILRSFGINVNYQMLQRPEVVAVSRGTVNVTDIVQTSAGTGNVGDIYGHGIAGQRLTLKRKQSPEHGTLFGFAVVRPVSSSQWYGDWFDRPRDYTSYYDPGLVPLPNVAVQYQDVSPTTQTTPTNTIGYQPWGQWYRRSVSRIHAVVANDFAIGSNTSQDPTALRLKTPSSTHFDLMFNDTTYGHFQVSAVNKLRALRLIPKNNLSTVTGMGG